MQQWCCAAHGPAKGVPWPTCPVLTAAPCCQPALGCEQASEAEEESESESDDEEGGAQIVDEEASRASGARLATLGSDPLLQMRRAVPGQLVQRQSGAASPLVCLVVHPLLAAAITNSSALVPACRMLR